MIPNDLVIPDADNFIFVRVGNRSLAGGATAKNARATVYWTPPTTLLLPADWIEAGTTAVPDVAPDAGVLAGPVTWHPSSADLPFGGHGCFIAMVDHAFNPAPIEVPSAYTTEEFLDFIGRRNNVAWRNFNAIAADVLPTVAPTPQRAGGFFMRGFADRGAWFDFRLVSRGLPEGAHVDWWMPEAVFAAMYRDIRRYGLRTQDVAAGAGPFGRDLPAGVLVRFPGPLRYTLRNVRLPSDAREPMWLTVSSPEPLESGAVGLRQSLDGLELGRITWSVSGPVPESGMRT
jgi:hypothetical protein